MPRKSAPIHPGEILYGEFLTPLGVSQYRLAKETNVPPRRINERDPTGFGEWQPGIARDKILLGRLS